MEIVEKSKVVSSLVLGLYLGDAKSFRLLNVLLLLVVFEGVSMGLC